MRKPAANWRASRWCLDPPFLAGDTQEIPCAREANPWPCGCLDGTTIIRLPGEGRHGEVVAMIAELRGQVPREAERTLVSPFDGQKRYGSSLRLENHDILATSTLTEAEVPADWEKSLHASVSMWSNGGPFSAGRLHHLAAGPGQPAVDGAPPRIEPGIAHPGHHRP